MQKKWYASKTLWSNALMLAGVIVLNATGEDILTPEVQGAILVVVNVVLRVVTKEEITW
ncbi:hypothetical protein [Desulfosporosinus nitroreducens]|uniref:hypothetical protein n=1 Tax=Desulfosporosinus nitroreducens TaxID=2018668 RepID=UPI00207D045E|nr:hypothetical protein [Desulfosporosinus nitroreducens]MCO1599804.1 hypothetical protein [Desulfosporosinus nitroreducens]